LPAYAAGLAVLSLLFVTSGCTEPTDATAKPGTSASTESAEATESAEQAAAAAVVSMDPPLGTSQFAPLIPVTIFAGNGTLTEVVILDPEGDAVSGTLLADATKWQATELLDYATSYDVTATAANSSGAVTAATGTIRTITPRTFTMPYFLPSQSMDSVGVGMPIVVRFDEDIEDRAVVERRLAVTTTPPVVPGPGSATARCTTARRITGIRAPMLSST